MDSVIESGSSFLSYLLDAVKPKEGPKETREEAKDTPQESHKTQETEEPQTVSNDLVAHTPTKAEVAKTAPQKHQHKPKEKKRNSTASSSRASPGTAHTPTRATHNATRLLRQAFSQIYSSTTAKSEGYSGL